MEIRKLIETPRCPHCRTMCRVQAEEVDTRFIADSDIGANIQFRKSRKSGKRRQAVRMDVTHVKRRDAHPAAALESIEGQVARNKPPQGASINGPVREEQIMPCLRHHPRPGRKRPWTMRSVLEFRVQASICGFQLPTVD